MGDENLKSKILEEYMLSATPEERRELKSLLDARQKRESRIPGMKGLNMDVSQLAKNMSKQINRQLGMADINIKKMAKDLVVQMALQHKPDITQKELSEIVSQMVPDKKDNGISAMIPADVLKRMIVQFISYSTGAMPQAERKNMPGGWEKKYWNTFPEDIKYLITAFLKNGIDSGSFWTAVDRILNKSCKKR